MQILQLSFASLSLHITLSFGQVCFIFSIFPKKILKETKISGLVNQLKVLYSCSFGAVFYNHAPNFSPFFFLRVLAVSSGLVQGP